MKNLLLLIACFMFTFSQAQVDKWKGKSVDLSHGRLKVSDNQRFLVFEDGTPFFYLGDTAWELFHRLSVFRVGLPTLRERPEDLEELD